MYTPESISYLTTRISWAEAQESSFVIDLNDSNMTGTSGRSFQAFHQLVTVENIYAAITDTSASSESFNALLSEIRKQSVLQIIPLVMDKHQDYDDSVDYSDVLISKAVLFDDAIGYQVAKSVLELFMSTKRSNLSERNSKLAMSNLKLEVEGFRNESGILIAKGVAQKLEKAIKDASKKIFPFSIIVKSENIW